MRYKRTLAGIIAGGLVAGAAIVGAAGAASATEAGPLLPGEIYFLQNAGGFDANTAADVNTSGDATARPFNSISADAQCPAGTTNVQAFARIPQAGVPETDWDQVSYNAAALDQQDSQGRFWAKRGDLMSKAAVVAYIASQPGNTGSVPFLLVCQGSGAGEVFGYFETTLTMTAPAGATGADVQWSIPAPSMAAFSSPSTTALAASATTVEAGTSVDLTATVTPDTATGDVEFFAGTNSLGTAPVTGGVASLSTATLPVGTSSVTAVYAGDASNGASTSDPVSVEVTAVAPRSTTTELTVSPLTGDAFQPVTFTPAVVAATGDANGVVKILDGSTVIGQTTAAAGVVAPFTSNSVGAGTHSFTAQFVGAAPYTDSVSAAVEGVYTLVGAVDGQTVDVEIPVGAITITSPYTPEYPLHLGVATLDPATSTYSASAAFDKLTITDTRAGQLGWTASVVSSPFANAAGETFSGVYSGLTDLIPVQIVGNALQAVEVNVVDRAPATDGLDVPKSIADYAADQPLGTVDITGTFGIAQVPSSVTPGVYTSTVTFTAL